MLFWYSDGLVQTRKRQISMRSECYILLYIEFKDYYILPMEFKNKREGVSSMHPPIENCLMFHFSQQKKSFTVMYLQSGAIKEESDQ